MSSGRSAKRVAKHPSGGGRGGGGRGKTSRGPEPGGAPARRRVKKKPATRAEDCRAVEVLPATAATARRVADLQSKLADRAALGALFAGVEADFNSFIP